MWYFTWLRASALRCCWRSSTPCGPSTRPAGRPTAGSPRWPLISTPGWAPTAYRPVVDRLYHWMTVLPEAHASHLLHRADLSEVSRR